MSISSGSPPGRLRSDLRAFAKLLDPEPVSAARDGLRMLGAKAGAARDAGVLSGRLPGEGWTAAAA